LNKRLLSLAALLAASVLIAAGCGGSDDDSSDSGSDSTEAAPTKAAYIEQADGLCAADEDKINAVAADLPQDINAPEVQDAITDELLPIYQEQLTALRDLTPPEGDEDATAAIYDALEDALTQVEEDPSTLASEDLFADANAKAEAFGLEVCGS
jgi:hypothetical protein